MLERDDQVSKVEQTQMGDVLAFPSRPYAPIEIVAPVKPAKKGTSPNQGYDATGRTREHLTLQEITQLLDKAKRTGRNAHRNYTLILIAYHHGLRSGEAATLKWSDINFEDGSMYVRRLKGSKPSTQPLTGDDMRALRKWQRDSATSPFVFVDGKGTPLKESAIASMIKRLGEGLFGFPIHVHMLRHSCGYYLANKGLDTRTIQDYLGHRNIQHTVRYTELSANKFKGMWD